MNVIWRGMPTPLGALTHDISRVGRVKLPRFCSFDIAFDSSLRLISISILAIWRFRYCVRSMPRSSDRRNVQSDCHPPQARASRNALVFKAEIARAKFRVLYGE
jgi:hypothetical protein